MRKLLILAFVFISTLAFAQKGSYQLSTHILDISTGYPATQVTVKLEKLDPVNGKWQELDKKVTDQNGRIQDFLPQAAQGKAYQQAVYKLTFYTRPYFESRKADTFYPYIEVVFELKDAKHYHVPITVSPYGYSTYRGS